MIMEDRNECRAKWAFQIVLIAEKYELIGLNQTVTINLKLVPTHAMLIIRYV